MESKRKRRYLQGFGNNGAYAWTPYEGLRAPFKLRLRFGFVFLLFGDDFGDFGVFFFGTQSLEFLRATTAAERDVVALVSGGAESFLAQFLARYRTVVERYKRGFGACGRARFGGHRGFRRRESARRQQR